MYRSLLSSSKDTLFSREAVASSSASFSFLSEKYLGICNAIQGNNMKLGFGVGGCRLLAGECDHSHRDEDLLVPISLFKWLP